MLHPHPKHCQATSTATSRQPLLLALAPLRQQQIFHCAAPHWWCSAPEQEDAATDLPAAWPKPNFKSGSSSRCSTSPQVSTQAMWPLSIQNGLSPLAVRYRWQAQRQPAATVSVLLAKTASVHCAVWSPYLLTYWLTWLGHAASTPPSMARSQHGSWGDHYSSF
jgi:hypothetical protein